MSTLRAEPPFSKPVRADLPASADYFSQYGEDRILSRLFPQSAGICVDVGAHDGVHLSNSYRFEQVGWRCILVEPTPGLCERIRTARPSSVLFECAASDSEGTATFHFVEGADVYSSLETEMPGKETIRKQGGAIKQVQVRTRKLDDILTDAGVNGRIDFISIDVEGHEIHVLRGFTLAKWRPRVAVIEDGAGDVSITPVQQHMAEHGYVRFYRTEVNDWYASPDEPSLRSLHSLVASGAWGFKGLVKAWLPLRLRRTLLLTNRFLFYRR